MMDRMTNAEKIEILSGYRALDVKIRYYKMAIEQYEEAKLQAGTQKIEAIPVASGSNKDLSDYVVKIEEMHGELYGKMLRALNYKNVILNWIEEIEDTRSQISVKYKYIQLKTIPWIAQNMELNTISEMTVNRLIKAGITNLPDLDEEKKEMLLNVRMSV